MPDQLDALMMTRKPTAERPLLGQTVLVIEDSRFASEALRLMSLKSGARVRRADCLKNAARHLSTYRPSVLIVDMGLPDGSGAKLIGELAAANPRIPVILGMSGDDGLRELAMDAGADGFLEKPIASLAQFQQAILDRLPSDAQPKGPRVLPEDLVEPDILALHDDLGYAAEVIGTEATGETIHYIAQFLGGIARSANDPPLEKAAGELARLFTSEESTAEQLSLVASLVDERLRQKAVI